MLTMKKQMLIIDFMNVWSRYYYIFGDDTPSIFRTKFMEKLIDSKYDDIFVILEGSNSLDWAKKYYSDYKANRVSSKDSKPLSSALSILKDYAKEFSPRVKFFRNNNCEADHVISALVAKYQSNRNIYVLSNDKDLLQLMVYPSVTVGIKFTGNVDIISPTKTESLKRFNIPSLDSFNNIIKYRIFKGDRSDNIPPAIPRMQTAMITKLINACWSDQVELSEEILDSMESMLTGSNIGERFRIGREALMRNWNLMQLTYLQPSSILKETMILGA